MFHWFVSFRCVSSGSPHWAMHVSLINSQDHGGGKLHSLRKPYMTIHGLGNHKTRRRSAAKRSEARRVRGHGSFTTDGKLG